MKHGSNGSLVGKEGDGVVVKLFEREDTVTCVRAECCKMKN